MNSVKKKAKPFRELIYLLSIMLVKDYPTMFVSGPIKNESGEVVGKNISIIYLKEDLPQLGQDIDKVIEGEHISNQERIIKK